MDAVDGHGGGGVGGAGRGVEGRGRTVAGSLRTSPRALSRGERGYLRRRGLRHAVTYFLKKPPLLAAALPPSAIMTRWLSSLIRSFNWAIFCWASRDDALVLGLEAADLFLELGDRLLPRLRQAPLPRAAP